MTTWALLAPGPSASAADAERVRDAGIPLGAVGNAFELAPWATFIAATDAAWWRRYPAARSTGAEVFTILPMTGVERVPITPVNSGVLALECAKRKGATRILLLGFDMRGTHFFGDYRNGLRNTKPHQRAQHLKQYAAWGKANRGIEVLNCTAGSALACFPARGLDACLAELAAPGIGAQGSTGERV